MIAEFSIPTHRIQNVIHDNASNMTLAMGSMSEFNSLPCFIHTTQLVVSDVVLLQPSVNNLMAKCKKVGNHLSASGPAGRRLAQIQHELKKPILKFINEVCTRWDSEFLSLERVRQMKEELIIWLMEVKYFIYFLFFY